MASSAVNTQGLTPATPANPDSKSSSEVASPLITTSPLITLSPQFSGSAFTHPPLSTGASLNSAALPADSLSDLAAPRVEALQPTLISGRLPTLPPGRLESNYDKAKKLIAAKAASLSRIGAAKGDVKHETAGYYQAYADAIIMAATDASGVPHNAVEVQGDIMRRYVSIGGGHSFFGYPISDETSTPDGACRYSLFQNGAGIFWTPATGACLLYGAIYQKFVALGGVYSSLSYPLNSESAAGSKGRFNDFQNGASIYWSGATGACLIYGEIHKKWSDLGGVQSFLGLPSTDETGAGSRGGRFNDFEGGSIYWSPYTVRTSKQGRCPRSWTTTSTTCSLLGQRSGDGTTSPFTVTGVTSSAGTFTTPGPWGMTTAWRT